MTTSTNTVQLFSRQLLNPDSSSHVIILHGLFAASDNLLRLGKDLSQYFNVHMLDLRNHGQSPHVADMDYVLMAGDVIRYMTDNHCSNVALIGHSMGGKTAMQVALLKPELVAGVVVGDIAPVDYEPGHNEIITGLTLLHRHPPLNRKEADEALAEYIDDIAVRQFLIKSLKRSEVNGGLEWRFNLEAIINNYAHVISAPSVSKQSIYKKPILFLSGELSDYIKPEHQSRTLSLFPSAQLKVIEGTTHWLHAQKPEVFNAICLRFLKTLPSFDIV